LLAATEPVFLYANTRIFLNQITYLNLTSAAIPKRAHKNLGFDLPFD
jgi:hypothetical protein